MSDTMTWKVVVGFIAFIVFVVGSVTIWYNYMVYKQRKEAAKWDVERKERLEAWKKWKESQKKDNPT